jgi:hypothetical protein
VFAKPATKKPQLKTMFDSFDGFDGEEGDHTDAAHSYQNADTTTITKGSLSAASVKAMEYWVQQDINVSKSRQLSIYPLCPRLM